MDGAPIKRVRLNNEFRPPSFPLPPFQKCPHHRTEEPIPGRATHLVILLLAHDPFFLKRGNY